jgi:hypothetical protein
VRLLVTYHNVRMPVTMWTPLPCWLKKIVTDSSFGAVSVAAIILTW